MPYAQALHENTLGCVGTLNAVLTRTARRMELGALLPDALHRSLLAKVQRQQILEETYAGAFTRSLAGGGNIRALYDHQGGQILGSTRSGTLQLREDGHGLAFTLSLPDTTYAQDLQELVRRGDVAGCSFGFHVPNAGDQWLKRAGGDWLRELRDVDLAEVTVTANPAYADTTVALRRRPNVHERDDWRARWLETCR